MLLPAFLLINSLAAIGGQSRVETPAWLSQAVDGFRRETGYPGVWMAVANRGRLIGVACSGLADVSTGERAKTDNVLRIGSISKPVLATIAAYYVQQGKLSYDDRLLEVVPELAAKADPAYRDVTLVMLLTHTAGIGEDARSRFDTAPSPRDYPTIRLAEVGKALRSAPISKPGTEWHYANYGYQAAAVLMERRVGKPYETMLDEVGRGVLGLASIGGGSPAQGGVRGHIMTNGVPKVNPDFRGHYAYEYGAFGMVHMTIADLVRFGLAYCPSSGSTALSSMTLQRVETESLNHQTLAGFLKDVGKTGDFTLHHGGSLTVGRGDRSVLWVNPSHGIVIAAQVNSGSKERDEIKDLKDKLVRPIFWQLVNGQTR